MTRTEAEKIVAQIKSHAGLVVLRGFDDCSHSEFWLLDLTGRELEEWWRQREEFWWAVTPESQEFDVMAAKIFGEFEEPPPLRPPMKLPGMFLPGQFQVSGKDDILTLLWMSFLESKEHYYCQICCDDDSFLKTPDGREIYHRRHPRSTDSAI